MTGVVRLYGLGVRMIEITISTELSTYLHFRWNVPADTAPDQRLCATFMVCLFDGLEQTINIMSHSQYIYLVGLKPRKPSQLLHVHTTSDQKSMSEQESSC